MLKFKDSKEVAMNAEARAVFEALRRIAGDDGVYKVIEAEEVLERLPAEMSSAGKQQLGTVIRQLRDDGFVKVKYFTPDEYCLLVENRQPEPETPPAPAVTEERPAAEETAEEPAAAAGKKEKPAAAAGKKEKPAPSASEESARKGGRIGVMLFAMFGGMIGGGIVAAIAILLQKFLLM